MQITGSKRLGNGKTILPPGYSPTKNQGVMDENGNPSIMSISDHERWVSSQIDSDENSIRKDKFETAFIYSADGTKLNVTQGKPDRVNFTNEQVDKMKDGVLTHNHPNGVSFSAADIDLFGAGQLRSIRATTPGGGTFELRRTGAMPKWMTGTVSSRQSKVESAIKNADSKIRPRIQKLVNDGDLAPFEAGMLHNHLQAKSIAKELGLSYSHKLSGSESVNLEGYELAFNGA